MQHQRELLAEFATWINRVDEQRMASEAERHRQFVDSKKAIRATSSAYRTALAERQAARDAAALEARRKRDAEDRKRAEREALRAADAKAQRITWRREQRQRQADLRESLQRKLESRNSSVIVGFSPSPSPAAPSPDTVLPRLDVTRLDVAQPGDDKPSPVGS